MRSHVILAVFKRNVASYFSGILGYLFIVVFVVAGAFLAFNDKFFASNLANLDQLSERFPLLLLFIVPAITMTAWADERKLGTDELLFTLPATDFEILLGKYLAVLAVYTVALAFSITHAFVLAWLGNPDWGLIFTTYLGYWLAGAALLAAGMFASVLTSSATVAFVLGAAICAIPVFIDQTPGMQAFVKNTLGINEPLGVAGHLKGFTSGKVTYAGVFYFVGLAAFFLYLNAVMIARRHWAGGKSAGSMVGQYLLRVGCLAVALLSLTYSLAVAGKNIDTTTERLHTLSPTTLKVLSNIPEDRTITIQAFVSPDVPQEYVAIRKELLNKLAEYDQRGGRNLQVRIVEVEPYSQQAIEAEALGVQPRQVQTESEGRFSIEDIYLGVVLTSGFDTITIPFFDRGTPIEYELTRSVGTASNEKRLTVGIMNSDANVNGGFDPRTFQQSPKWRIVQELAKQYDIKEIPPENPITQDIDVLVAILPSSLTAPQMQNLVDYVQSGRPVLILDDPVPIWGPNRFTSGISVAPLEPKPDPGGGMMGMQRNQQPPKADNGEALSLMDALGVRWDVRKSLFDINNPNPRFAEVYPEELIFLTGEETINPNNAITSGLQEILAFAPGVLRRQDPQVEFEELLRTRKGTSGLNDWNDITRASFFGGRQYDFNVPHTPGDESYVLAARIKSDSEDKKVNAIFIADVDLVHDVMFDVWQQQVMDLKIDNVLFVLNSVDTLANDDRFVTLRKRRAAHRTLTELEKSKQSFEKRRSQEIAEANAEAEKAVADAQARLDTVLADLRKEMQEGNVDIGTLQVRINNAQEAENRKLQQTEREIERRKQERIRHVRSETSQEIRKIERSFWRRAVLIPPIPAILLGIIVILMRISGERQGIASDRLRDKSSGSSKPSSTK